MDLSLLIKTKYKTILVICYRIYTYMKNNVLNLSVKELYIVYHQSQTEKIYKYHSFHLFINLLKLEFSISLLRFLNNKIRKNHNLFLIERTKYYITTNMRINKIIEIIK